MKNAILLVNVVLAAHSRRVEQKHPYYVKYKGFVWRLLTLYFAGSLFTITVPNCTQNRRQSIHKFGFSIHKKMFNIKKTCWPDYKHSWQLFEKESSFLFFPRTAALTVQCSQNMCFESCLNCIFFSSGTSNSMQSLLHSLPTHVTLRRV